MAGNDDVSRRMARIAERMRPDVPIFSDDEIRFMTICGRWAPDFWMHQTKEKAREDIRWLIDKLAAAQHRVTALEKQIAASAAAVPEGARKGDDDEQ